MKLTLYYAPFSCALIPHVLLTETGAEFDVEVMSLRSGDHLKPEFLRINPRHRVPVLLIDGQPLVETMAMELFLARSFPAARLMPADFRDEIRAVSLLAWCASGIHPTLTPNALPQRYCDLPDSEDSVRRCAQKLLHENYALADQMLAGREWFFEHFTAVDAHFFWCFRRGQNFGVDVSAYPHCRAHFERMRARPSVQRLEAFEAEVLARG